MQIKVSDLRFYSHSDNSDFSEISEFVLGRIQSSELSFLALYIKTITRTFLWHMESCMEVKISSSKLSFFCSRPKTITRNSYDSTKAFNSENIVQVCLLSFRTHRVNKDFSNSVKDALSELSFFGIGQYPKTRNFSPKYDFSRI